MVYGAGPDDVAGSGVMRQMRELRTLAPCIGSTDKPAGKAEASRIEGLMPGTPSEPRHTQT